MQEGVAEQQQQCRFVKLVRGPEVWSQNSIQAILGGADDSLFPRPSSIHSAGQLIFGGTSANPPCLP